jgi:hypothetical protein
MCSESILILPLHAQKIMRKTCITIVLLVFFMPFAYSQRSGDLGIMGGAGYYVGDLNPATPFRMPKAAFGVMYRYNINSRVGIRFHGIYGKVAGDDAVSNVNPSRNLNFESKITEVGTQLEINFFDYFVGSKYHRITPYLFGGINFFMFEPFGTVGGNFVALKPLKTEGEGIVPDRNPYNLYAISYPLGLGVKYSVSKLIGVGAEWGLRKTTTDYLDDVSSTYYFNADTLSAANAVKTEFLASDPGLTHQSGMQRGNSRDTDWYAFALVHVTVKIRMLKKERCLDHQREGH